MKTINLHFKDAVVSRLEEGKYLFTFDLSGLMFDRFSKNTRVYLNNLNLCEFRDNDENKELNGFFEIGCNFINDSDVIDSSGNSGGNTIIYQGNLNSYHTFSNPAPLFSYNYKINENAFNNGRLQFTINFYDEEGGQFVQWTTLENILDTTSTEYTTFKTFEYYHHNNLDKLVINKAKLDVLAQRLNTFKVAFDGGKNDYRNKRTKFIDDLDKVVSGARVRKHCNANGINFNDNILKHTLIDTFISSRSFIDISNFFNGFNFADEPYFANNLTDLAKTVYPQFKDQDFFNRFSLESEIEVALAEHNNFETFDPIISTRQKNLRYHIDNQRSTISNFQMLDYTSDVFANAVSNNKLLVANDTNVVEYSATGSYFKKTSDNVAQSTPYVANLKIFMKMKCFQNNDPFTTTIKPDVQYFPTIVRIEPLNDDITSDDNLSLVDSSIFIKIGNESGSDQNFFIPLNNLSIIPQVATGIVNGILTFDLDHTALTALSNDFIRASIKLSKTTMDTQEQLVPTIENIKSVLFSDSVEKKLPAINMSLVLYDEAPLDQEYENTKDPVKAINKNSLSTLNLPSFRRF